MGWIQTTNSAIARSAVGRYFLLEGCGHPRERKGTFFFTEMRAGLATFFAMAYIIAVNASIVSQTGGTCVCPAGSPDLCVTDPQYLQCVQEVQRDLVTATAAISALTSFCMGLFANVPLALAPGMGINAYFTYTVVGFHGSGLIPYRVALTAVFVEGFVFVGLTLLGIRQWLARAIPASIKLAMGVGIGLFLAIVGLTYNAGIGLITGATATPLELAGCSPQYRDADTLICSTSQVMRSPTMWIGIFCGGFFTVFLMMFRVKGAIIAGILLVSITSWPRGTPVTYFPYTDLGDSMFDFFKQVVTFHPITRILNVQEWNLGESGGQFAIAFITFLYVDILDTTATLYSMARFAGLIDEVTQDFEGSATAYLVDAFGISIGALFGCPPVTAFIESGAGISEGGRTGLTAMASGVLFFVSIFFAPIFASIPPWATGCTLVLIGSLMMKSVVDINWKYMGDAIPAFLTIIVMPFTYSIAYGLIAGIMSYIILNGGVFIIEKASGNRIRPVDKEHKDFWTYKVPGGVFPPWLTRAAHGKKDFWRGDEESASPVEGVDAAVPPRPKGMESLVGEVKDSSSGSS